MDGSIVVGIDHSSASKVALGWAAGRAASLGSALVVAHVIDDEWGVSDEQHARAAGEVSLAVAELLREFGALEVRTVLRQGNPTRELAAIAARSALLVVGTHKTGFIQGKAFGSRGLRLASMSPVPVAVIPERGGGARSGIVAGIDGSPAGREAVRFAAAEAQRTGDDLLLLLASGRTERLLAADEISPRSTRALRESDLTATALRIAEEAGPDVGIRVRVVHRSPATAIVDVASNASLLVVGSSRQHRHGRVALGPVSHDVLFNISCPTVVVHPVVVHPVAVASALAG